MCDKTNLVFTGSHEVRRIRCFGDAVLNRRVNFAGNGARTKLGFDIRVEIEDELMRIAHLLRYRTKRIRPRSVCDITGVTSNYIDHDWVPGFQFPAAPHGLYGRIKSTHADWTIEVVWIRGGLTKRDCPVIQLHVEAANAA